MRANGLSPSSQKTKREVQPGNSGREQTDSPSAKPASKGKSQPSGSGLKRADSLPARLPSHPLQRAEVKPIRNPITRPASDTVPPKDFAKPPRGPRNRFCFNFPFQKQVQTPEMEKRRINAGGAEKIKALQDRPLIFQDVKPELENNPEYLEIIKENHPNYDIYNLRGKANALRVLDNHPGFLAAKARIRNEKLSVPNGPTATREMTPGEQTFLTQAFRRLNEDIRANPFHMHGETAITGNQKGEVDKFNHTPAGESHALPETGDKYHLHTHPPFMEPLTSSASEDDHRLAAIYYATDGNQTGSYVTNGKDVLHIQPHSLELVKLTPNPELEKSLGKFPVAFKLPKPQPPPHPFSNHEAPAAFTEWALPRSWKR